MALRLNLYHEIEKAKQAKRRDPLKLSMIALGVIMALFAGYYFLQLAALGGVNQDLARKEMELKAITPKAELAQKQIDELSAVAKVSQSLVDYMEKRLYWAPILELITKIVPAELQIVKLTGTVQGEAVKKCTLILNGISSGADPRKSAETLRMSIEKQLGSQFQAVSATFRTLDDGIETINMGGVRRATAVFEINVQFATGVEEAPAFVPKKRVKSGEPKG